MFVFLETPSEWRLRVLTDMLAALDSMSWMHHRLCDWRTAQRYAQAHNWLENLMLAEGLIIEEDD